MDGRNLGGNLLTFLNDKKSEEAMHWKIMWSGKNVWQTYFFPIYNNHFLQDNKTLKQTFFNNMSNLPYFPLKFVLLAPVLKRELLKRLVSWYLLFWNSRDLTRFQ